MGRAASRAARVRVDFSQYQVAGGPGIVVGDDIVPGLLRDLGPQTVAILTGLHSGTIAVTAEGLTAPPDRVAPAWDVVAETDLDCPDGTISVLDWGGPDHPELGELALGGPGRYRLRVHARDRHESTSGRTSERHHLQAWPVSEARAPRLLTEMDARGRTLAGEDHGDAPALDEVEARAASSVRQLARFARGSAPRVSAEAVLLSRAEIAATRRKIWNVVSEPRSWLANRGGGDPAHFRFNLADDPALAVTGDMLDMQPPETLEFSWSWTLSAQPTAVRISLSLAGKGVTLVELEHRGIAPDLAGPTREFWDWALQRELPDRITNAEFRGHPWTR